MQHPANGLYMANSASAPSSAAPSVAGSASACSPANSVIHVQQLPNSNIVHSHSHAHAHAHAHAHIGHPVLPMHSLPDRNVDSGTIEDAYVSFIFACNPAVLPNVDTTALREAFRTPPRSDGKSFSIYILYQLICKLEERTIKTWAELALELGVEPPNQDKGQSSQKIQQYAVRLKRWMHSMHVNAFFDYLMGREHPYWTEIPPENYPIGEILRDGVAAKDDMALRALIPEIKPRRGRKRDDDTDSEYMNMTTGDQHPRVDNTYAEAWASGQTVTAAAGANAYGYASSQQLSPDGTMRASPPWGTGDSMSSSMSHGGFWAGDEYKPPVNSSPASSGRRPGRRHGAKVVSSAWRSGGAGGSGKTRGRPPINRAGNHHASSPTPDVSFPPVSVIERTTPPFPPQTASTYLPHMESSASISPLPPSAMTVHAHPDLHAVPSMSAVGNTPGGILPPPIPQPAYSGAIDPQLRGAARPNHHLSLQDSSDRKGNVHLAHPSHMHGLQSNVMSDGPEMSMHVSGMPHSVSQTVNDISLNSYGASHLGMPPTMGFVPSELLHGQHPHPHHLGDQHSPLTMHPHPQHHSMAATGGPPTASETTPSYTSDPIIDSTHKPGEGKNAWKDPIKPLPLYQSRFGSGSPNDRTNIDELEAFFMTEMFAATWYDENDNKITPCSVEEATALVEIVINDLTKAAPSKEAFLINLAALAGGKILMANTDARVKRLERTAEYTRYECSWELRYGDVRGQFSIQEAVPHARWKKLTNDVKAAVARACGLAETSSSPSNLNPSNPNPSNLSNSSANAAAAAAAQQAQNSQNSQDSAAFFNSGQDNSAFPIYNTAHFTSTGRFDTATSAAAYTQAPINFGLPLSAMQASAGSSGVNPNLGTAGDSSVPSAEDNAALAAFWERKYRHLLHLLYKRDQQLDRTRASVLRGLQDTYQDEDRFDI